MRKITKIEIKNLLRESEIKKALSLLTTIVDENKLPSLKIDILCSRYNHLKKHYQYGNISFAEYTSPFKRHTKLYLYSIKRNES